jgi:cytochrome c5
LVWKQDKHEWLLSILLIVGTASVAHAVAPGSAEQVRERTAPVGQVCRAGMGCGGVAATAGPGGTMSGQQIYDQYCFVCHATGVTEAPRFANAEDWETRVTKGMDTLLETTLSGMNAMPAKGTCMACSEDELQAAIDYMVDGAQ